YLRERRTERKRKRGRERVEEGERGKEREWPEPEAPGWAWLRPSLTADEREAVQKKTFTKWMNSHLARVGCHIADLYADLRDGFVLTRLLEVLSGEQLPRPTRGRMRIHSLENVDKALQFLKEQRVHLENVGSHDIVDGNHRLTLGLVWTIILRFQIQVIKIETEDNRETRSAKDALLLWCQMKTAGYPEVNIQNFTTSWRDGLAFNALIHRHRPDLVDFSKLTKSNANYNLQRAFRTAEQHLGLARLLDPEDVNMEAPDEKSIITYVVSFYHYFSKMKALAVEGKRIGKVLDQVLEVGKIIERYEELAAELLAWIHRTVGLISNQKFANSLSGVQQQLQAFTAYCTLEKPVKFQEKGNLEVLLFSIQSKLRAYNRRLYVPREGCGIWDIDKAWGELEKAEHEREAALRAELIRQEKLELLAQRFDHKVAMRESWLNENQRLVSQVLGVGLGWEVAGKGEWVGLIGRLERLLVTENSERRSSNRRVQVGTRLESHMGKKQGPRGCGQCPNKAQGSAATIVRASSDQNLEGLAASKLSSGLVPKAPSILFRRFESLDQEMNSLMGRVLDVNQTVQELVEGGHPSSDEVRSCQDHLNSRWNRIVELVEQRKEEVSAVLLVENHVLEVAEVRAQVREKRRAVESAPRAGGALQWRLSGLEAALQALEPRQAALQEEAALLAERFPAQAARLHQGAQELGTEWGALAGAAQACGQAVAAAGRLQRFLRDLDTFLDWLVRAQEAAGGGGGEGPLPGSLEEADALLARHAALKEEVDQREEDYARIVAASEALLAAEGGAELGPGLALDEWLPHLEVGWHKLLGLWEERREALVQAHVYQLFLRDLCQALAVLRNQEVALSGAELPGTVEAVEEALKRHGDFLTTMELNQQKMQVAVQAAEGLLRQGNAYGEQAQEAVARLLEKRWDLGPGLDGWIHEKMLTARDGTRDDGHKLHKRWLRHQAFMAELAQNKEWLEKIEREGQQLMQEKPELAASVRKKLGEIRQCWAELESTTQAKARQLFEASKADQLVQSFAELDKKLLHMESQLQDVDPGGDLATVNSQLKRLQSMESQVEEWYREVGELQAQTASLPLEPASKELVGERQSAVGERLVRLLQPLQERRRLLLASKELHQVAHDLEDELAWVQERLPLAMQTERGNGLQAVQQYIKKNQALRREMQAHGPRLEEVLERAGVLASLRSPEAEAVRQGREQLQGAWAGLREAAERRQQTLDAAFQVEQYYFDVAEVEAWLGEQELLMMSEDKGKDEQSTLQLLKKHLQLEQGVENYEESIAQLSRQCRALLEMGHPDSEQISRRQSQVDRLYVALKELGEERRVGLEQQYWLYQLSRQVDELEHWIAEKEVVAGSPELGQDFEHVSVLQEKFSEFASETGTAGRERLAAVNQMVDELIECGHAAAATMAEWKDGLNEAWAELLELMGTRAQLLAASRELHKFFSDARDLQGQIEEKRRRLPRLAAPPEPRPSASSMQRTLKAFEHDLQLLVSQVRQLQEGAAQLRTVYAGEHADAIASREQEVLQGWKELLAACEDARVHVSSTADALRFHGQARDLLAWMDGVAGQIGAADKPRDVSSVEVLMNYHQGLKTELEARMPELTACQELGRSLLLNKSAMADEIQAQLGKLGTRKEEVSDKWDRHWEWLQQMLEVHQFAQEAVVADAWLTAQEPLLQSRELGSSVDEVEQLIRRHEAFRKAAAAWEERFSSLRRLTTIEKLKAEQSKQPPTPLLGRKFFGDPTEVAAKAAPLLRPGGYERGLEPLARRASDTLSAEVRTRVGYVRQELKPERLQPRIDRLPEVPGRIEPVAPPAAPSDATETPASPAATELVRPRPERQESVDRAEEMPRRRRSERQESSDQPEEAARRRRPERQESTEHEAAHSLTLGRYEQMERRRERRERRLERQESSEQEIPTRGDLIKGKATLADIVEQLQEKEASPGLTAGPSLPQPRELPPGRLPNGLEPPERTPRPDRPRARDRPKPRRRPRPREGGEGAGSRRSRSAPAQGGSAPAPPTPPTHTVQHEGFLLRKREVDANRKSSNRSWVSLYCVLSKGELGFYKDAKGPASGGTHGGEPLLSLHKATSEVANDYKKKKHVFKLQTQDGSEFLLQAKDEEEMNGWLEAVASSVAEHAEIARWGQTLPTTSSTDEGNPKGGERRASGRRK
uniref:Spectrin beta chain n=1 Tax=Jaculus jaculus TaxID=51337 RepID=A0A8C5KXA3_JACJA